MNEQATCEPPKPTRSAAAADEQADPGVIAQRLRYLLDQKRKPNGKRYSYREVLRAIEEQGGPTMSVGYLSQLVTGVRKNPMMDAVQGLATFFGVSISYFDPKEDTTETNRRLKLLAALQYPGVLEVATCAMGLSPKGIKLVESILDRVRQIEGLPPIES